MEDRGGLLLNSSGDSRDLKKSGHASLLDSGEDFDMLEDEDIEVDDVPPLEDIGGAAKENSPESNTVKAVADSCLSSHHEDWLDVLGNGQLRKKIIQAGSGPGSKPQRGQNVTISFKSTLTDGTTVEEETNISFTLGDGDVIQALDITVQLMELGEKALIEVGAKYAYDKLGSSSPVIPPNADLILEVHLLSTVDAPDLELLSPTERIRLASKKRERGNFYYQRGEYAFAVNSYSIALQITEASFKVDISPLEEEELMDEKVKCLNNMAAAQLKMDHYEAAMCSCISVLTHQPENIKALFRQGKVLAIQGEYTEAIRILKRALKLEPSNKTIHLELSKLVKKHSEQKGVEQAMYKKMLGNPCGINILQKPQTKSSWSVSWKWLFGATAIAIGGVALSVVIAARN